MNKLYLYISLLCLGAIWLVGCSAERHNPISKIYQNTAAHYNGFFLGHERLKALEAGVAAKALPDYNHLLPIFPVIDSVAAAGMKKELEEIQKKASYPLYKHPSSDWTDDSYLLIGKTRYYGLEYDEAIKTFKYINSTSKSEVTRHEALLWLMRCFVNTHDLESAKAVSDVMKKEFLSKENATLLFLTRAQYYLLRKDNKLAIENLKLALPLIEKKDEELRIRFILAQLYQENNQDKLAYQQFNSITRRNPPYELGFQSKLRLGQVTEINSTSESEKIVKSFRKLLKDTKNREYLDKIYYEMARFELKQNKPAEALKYLNHSVRVPSKNTAQKGYSYLLAGKIHYDNMQKYREAQQYYDSAVQVLPPNAPEYTAAVERRDILNEFASHYTVVEREDSLQTLAKLDKSSLDARIDVIIKKAEEQRIADAKRATDAAARAANGQGANNLGTSFANANNPIDNAAGNNSTNGLWYFDNPLTVASARAEFTRRWGNRRLQDNWRTTNQTAEDPQQTLATNTNNNQPVDSENAAAATDALRVALLRDIPTTPEQRITSDKRIEDGLFNLAAIYRDKLKEPVRAIETYEKLLARFPKTKHAAELYYALFLLYKDNKDAKQNTYAALVKQQFPGSRYAKLIDQPDYLAKVSAGNAEVKVLYEKAFTLYEKKQYKAASDMLISIQERYPDSDLRDKVAFLNVLITAQTEQPPIFKLVLQQFISKYPESALADKAKAYLSSFALYETGKLSETEFDKTHPQKTIAVNNVLPARTSATPRAEAPTTAETVIKEPQQPLPAEVPQRISQTLPPAAIPAQTAQNTEPAAQQPVPEQNTVPAVAKAPSVANTPVPPVNNPVPANTANAAPETLPIPVTPAPTEPAKPKFTLNMQAPHLVLVAYPKGNPAFTGILEKIQTYNSNYNAADQLNIEIGSLNNAQDLIVVKEFISGQRAKAYAIKQRSPQSPLSKIRGIEFVTFVISSENLPVLLQEGKLDDYLLFYKTNY
ncbi:tetratricopeptide repeat protein [Adhaeribacter aquaticus]|uniref:type IX secretion system periplasmic lipoprotein PorW/SprE n=1 Tax=Adhaeribacter aquaticus TaxID=299567 RepID=UPI00041E0BF3|nr:tetratricopeptide repeat protein [Adhaeribacter aquaticus]